MSNFDFLKEEWGEIYQEVKAAEENTLLRPRYAGVLLRSTLEKMVFWMYENDSDLEFPYDTKLSSLLYNEDFKNELSPSGFRELNIVRKTGNQAAHGERISTHQTMSSLKYLFSFASLFSRWYSETNASIPTFDESIIPTGREKDKSKEELKKLHTKLTDTNQQLLEVRKKLEKQAQANEQLKKQLEEQQQVLQMRKAERQKTLDTDPIPQLIPEAETRKLFIDILLREAGWNIEAENVKEFEVRGMPQSVNKTGKGFADYVFWGEDGKPLMVVEAKKTMKSARDGKTQAELYANCLEEMFGQRPLIYYTNGFEHYLWDDQFYPEREVQGFYSQEEAQLAIHRRGQRKDIRQEKINAAIAGRYYQLEAIQRVMSHFATEGRKKQLKGKHRKALLVMATGTGKTRTAIAMVDLLSKANWVKKVLFLADRNSLLLQAKNAFKNHLPQLSAVDLTQEKEETHTRLVFSTYPTMMNQIDGQKIEGKRLFGVGHFDLIIIDEAHRSVYHKYKAIFDYFDSLLIGLTATPKSDIDRNTYELFELEDYQPTFSYELGTAVADGFLVPSKAVDVPIKFMREGIKYSELSAEEKEEYELKFGDPSNEDFPDEISNKALNTWLFNKDTVNKVLQYLMEYGLKEDGENLGKTIIFAKNHQHAEFIEEQFNKLYPQFSNYFLRVIDTYDSKAQYHLENFCDPIEDKDPQIAVSVDMMDTGVDAPKVLNLVFFKAVKSSTKFWQMIGRGTRLYPNLFGQGEDKSFFYIFDFCQNFDFFDAQPEGIQATANKSLSTRIFEKKIKLAHTLATLNNKSEETEKLKNHYLDQLHEEVQNLDRERFDVRQNMQKVLQYSKRSEWDKLKQNEIYEIIKELAPLANTAKKGTEKNKGFDLLVLNAIEERLAGKTSRKTEKIAKIAENLLQKTNIPKVKEREETLQKIETMENMEGLSLEDLEAMRKEIRELMPFVDKEKTPVTYTNFSDEIQKDSIIKKEIVYQVNKRYKQKVEQFIQAHKTNITISKIFQNQAITQAELEGLEKLVFDGESRGTFEDLQKELGQSTSLGKFIRSILGLDRNKAKEAFADFIQQRNLDEKQIRFIDLIIDSFANKGVIEKKMLREAPFNHKHRAGIAGLFPKEDVQTVFQIIENINRNAEAS